jgi:hypothetical protein
LDTAEIPALISRLESGELFDLSPPEQPSGTSHEIYSPNGSPTKKISAELIRSILLGFPVSPLKPALPQTVKVTSAGIRIKSATITGQLNLDDLAGSGGGPLPALYFHKCVFEQEISLKRCHLRSLSLVECRVTELQAEEATIDGPVKLSGICRPAETTLKDHQGNDIKSLGSYVVLRGAKIDGHVDCAHASFAVLPRGKDNEPFVPNSKHSRFALDFRAARIRGSVLLRPGVTALGGISFTLAQVQGSVWCNGAELIAVEDCAFSADYAEIRGSCYLRTYDFPNGKQSRRFVAKGQVSFFATKIGGALYMEGADLRRCEPLKEDSETDEYVSLDVTNATIGGNCKLSWWHSFAPPSVRDATKRIYPFKAEGIIALNSASIRNYLMLSGANIDSLHATRVEMGGNCHMSIYDGPFTPTTETPERPRMTATAIHMEGAVIKGDLFIRGAVIGTKDANPEKDQGFFARGARIGGNCELATCAYEDGPDKKIARFECYGRVHLQEGTIGNSLLMDGARIVCKKHSPKPAVDISGTTIGGHAKFWTWLPEESSTCIPFEVEADQAALRMTGTKIAQKLFLNGAVITTSKLAIDAGNVEVGGKASLSTYKSHSFTASGKLNFVGATIRLGLDMSGARIKPPASETAWNKAEPLSRLIALDLTLGRMKFVKLIQFEAVGQVILQHAEIDTDIFLKGSSFQGRIVLDFARIGASVELVKSQLWSVSARTIYERILGNYSGLNPSSSPVNKTEVERSVRDELARYHAAKQTDAGLSMHSAKIGGELIVDELRIFQQYHVDGYSSMPEEFSYVTADLRGLHVGELNDKGGLGWKEHPGNPQFTAQIHFWLEGFNYKRLNELPPSLGTPSAHETRHGRDEVWKARREWLDLQYFDKKKPHMTEFTPGAYEQLVKTLNVDGLYEDARRIASVKITLERKFKPKGLRKFGWWIFWALFEYGFS